MSFHVTLLICSHSSAPTCKLCLFSLLEVKNRLQTSLTEKVVVDGHGCQKTLNFGVKYKVPVLNWLPKLHKPHMKHFFANSSYCILTELSKLLISCLTAIKNT